CQSDDGDSREDRLLEHHPQRIANVLPKTVHKSNRSNRSHRSYYSYLSAIIGSTFVALRAGTKQAPRATPARIIEITKKVVESVALTPNNKLDIKRVVSHAPPRPIASPTTASF